MAARLNSPIALMSEAAGPGSCAGGLACSAAGVVVIDREARSRKIDFGQMPRAQSLDPRWDPAPGAACALVTTRRILLPYIIYCRATTCCTVVNRTRKFATIQVPEGLFFSLPRA